MTYFFDGNRVSQCVHSRKHVFKLLWELYLSITAELGLRDLVISLLRGNGPVHEEKIDIVELEVAQGVLQGPLDILGLVKMVPDLSGDEDIFTLDVLVLLQKVVEGEANLVLIAVEPGAIQMSVANLQGSLDGIVSLTRLALASEGTETKSGNLDAVVKGEYLMSHDE